MSRVVGDAARKSSWRWSRSSSHFHFRRGSTSLQTLAFEEMRSSEDEPDNATALVLHGLLGSERNWRSFTRNLIARICDSPSSTDWRMVLVDLRNHGKSAGLKGLDPPHDMVNAAKDLAHLVKSHNWSWPDVVVGHSMGGKVALEFAASCARGSYGGSVLLPKQLWVLDSVPGEVRSDDGEGEVEKVLEVLQKLPSQLPSRKWVVDHMLNLGFSQMLSNWIGSNLKNDGEHVIWAFDLQAAVDMFNSFRATSYWSLLEHPPKGLEINIVRAQNSDRWDQNVVERLECLSRKEWGPEEGKVILHVLPNSGHWVHVDNPKGLLDIMAPNFYLNS